MAAQLAYARYFCAQGGGRFVGLRKNDDSHCPCMPFYRAMLEVWLPIEAREHQTLTKDQISQIVNAGYGKGGSGRNPIRN